MKARKLMMAVAAMIAAGIFIFAGCSSDETGGSSNTESFTDQVIEDMVESTYVDLEPAEPVADFASVTETPTEIVIGDDATRFYDIILKENVIYAAVDDGVIVYDMIDGGTSLVPSEKPITSIVDLGDKILVGGDNLYNLEGEVLSDDDFQLNLDGTITALYHSYPELYVGTNEGFYSVDPSGIRKLADGINVSALASDGMGIWVGTAGEGLYRWNGDSFKKRYLKRDSTLFDNVTALDFKHNHLYLGTDNGLYVHDGGAWTPFGLADGLPSEMITAIDASEWVVKIGTNQGPVTFFDNQFKLMSKLEGMVVTDFIKAENKLLAATMNAGLVMKSGGLVTTLFDGDIDTTQVAFEQQW